MTKRRLHHSPCAHPTRQMPAKLQRAGCTSPQYPCCPRLPETPMLPLLAFLTDAGFDACDCRESCACVADWLTLSRAGCLPFLLAAAGAAVAADGDRRPSRIARARRPLRAAAAPPGMASALCASGPGSSMLTTTSPCRQAGRTNSSRCNGNWKQGKSEEEELLHFPCWWQPSSEHIPLVCKLSRVVCLRPGRHGNGRCWRLPSDAPRRACSPAVRHRRLSSTTSGRDPARPSCAPHLARRVLRGAVGVHGLQHHTAPGEAVELQGGPQRIARHVHRLAARADGEHLPAAETLASSPSQMALSTS